MNTLQVALDVRETPVFFPAANEECFGILTEPRAASSDVTVVLLKPGRFAPMERNRMWVRLAHRLAAEGFPVLRFDYHGVGDSTGTVRMFSLSRPFVEDVDGAMQWLRAHRPGQGVVLVGACFGTRTVLASAGNIPELRGALLIGLPVGDDGTGFADRMVARYSMKDYVRRGIRRQVFLRFFDPSRRRVYRRIAWRVLKGLVSRAAPGRQEQRESGLASDAVIDQVRGIARRRIPLMFIYGSIENQYRQFQRAMKGTLGEIVRRANGTIEVVTVDGRVSIFKTVQVQEAAIRETVAALRSLRERGMFGRDSSG